MADAVRRTHELHAAGNVFQFRADLQADLFQKQFHVPGSLEPGIVPRFRKIEAVAGQVDRSGRPEFGHGTFESLGKRGDQLLVGPFAVQVQLEARVLRRVGLLGAVDQDDPRLVQLGHEPRQVLDRDRLRPVLPLKRLLDLLECLLAVELLEQEFPRLRLARSRARSRRR